MTPDELIGAVAVGLVVAAILLPLAYSYGHAKGRLAEQDNLKWRTKKVEDMLDDVRELQDMCEDRIGELNNAISNAGGEDG